jgi:hypothetical protein
MVVSGGTIDAGGMKDPAALSPPPLTSWRLNGVSWRLVAALGAFALVRPLLSITGLADDWGKPTTPLLATVVITVVWIAAVLIARQPRPLETLVLVGLAYAVLATVLSGVLSPVLEGELQGPLTNPIALVAMLVINGVWGLFAGAIALVVRQALAGR